MSSMKMSTVSKLLLTLMVIVDVVVSNGYGSGGSEEQ